MKKLIVLTFCIIFTFLTLIGHASVEDKIKIFSKEYMEQNFQKSLRPWTYSYWTPSIEQVKQINIIDYLKEHNLRNEIKDINVYVFQYYGIVENGKKIVCIQAVCTDEGNNDWKEELYIVKGGGNCFFHLLYDLKTKQFSDFYTNAPA